MIRILHTADWHIGQTLRGFPRDYEHARVFAEIAGIIAEKDIDALVVAGDIFDSQNPSGEAQQLFYDTLAGFSRARDRLTIVVVAGNHDAASRLEAPAALLQSFKIHVVGSLRRRDGRILGERHLVPVTDAGGIVAAYVVAVSHPTAACLPHLPTLRGDGESPVVAGVRAIYAELMDALAPRIAGLPFVLTGHLHISSGTLSEGAERRILVGGEHAVPTDVFPPEARYVALGHLHRAQQWDQGRIRYAGSLFPLSAAEMDYRHGVSLITIDGEQTQVEHLPLSRPVPFLRLPASGDMPLADLGQALEQLQLPPDLPVEHHPFVQLRLTRQGLPGGFREEVDRIAESFPVRMFDVRVVIPGEQPEPAADPLLTLAERQPEDLFRLAFARHHGREPEDPHLDIFHRIVAEAGA